MDRISVQSSNICSIGYDTDKRILEIEFKSGSVYQYFNVPQEVYNELVQTSSVGRYFTKNIKDVYQCNRVG